MNAIAFEHLVKRYGDFTAVDDLSLDVPEGSVCGLLGPNGAGKSTAFKCLLGLAKATSGGVTIAGKTGLDARRELAYVPERPALHEWLSATDHFEVVRRIDPRFDAARAKELCALFKIDPRRTVKKMSKGQQTAVSLALAFSVRPKVYVLDEPASGLDPVFQRAVLDLIIDAAAGGATVLFSSHQIGQVERAADRVAILDHGKLVVSGDLDDLRGSRKIVEAIFPTEAPELGALASDPRIARATRTGRILRLDVTSDPQGVARAVEALGPKTVDVVDVGLEEIFLGAVGAAPSGVV